MRRDTIITGRGSVISRRAVAAANRLRRNTTDWHTERITDDVWNKRARRIWRCIARNKALYSDVLVCLRENIA